MKTETGQVGRNISLLTVDVKPACITAVKEGASVFVLRIFVSCLLKFDRFAEKGKTNENSTDI